MSDKTHIEADACGGGKQGVLAFVALDKLSKQIRDLMNNVDKDLTAKVEDIKKIERQLKHVAGVSPK